MSEKQLPRDELKAVRWFREHLRHVARQYPQLTTTTHQERLSAYLTQQAREEQTPCPENPPADHQDGHQEADSSQTPGA